MRYIKHYTHIYLYTKEKLSGQISCGLKILDKLGCCPNDFQNHTARPTFFKNGSKSRLFGKKQQGFPFKINTDQISKEFSCSFCSRSDQFIKDFSCKFEGDLNFLVNFFLAGFIFKGDYYMNLKMISISWWTFFGNFLISFFVARYLTVSLRGPVLKP